MEQAVAIKIISFPLDAEGSNPLPYVPAMWEYTEHVKVCVQCAAVDQRAKAGEDIDMTELCDGGATLHLMLMRRIMDQHGQSLLN